MSKLRDLMTPYRMNNHNPLSIYSVGGNNLDLIEAELLAPKDAEIARLKEDRANLLTWRKEEIDKNARLTSDLAAIRVERDAYYNLSHNSDTKCGDLRAENARLTAQVAAGRELRRDMAYLLHALPESSDEATEIHGAIRRFDAATPPTDAEESEVGPLKYAIKRDQAALLRKIRGGESEADIEEPISTCPYCHATGVCDYPVPDANEDGGCPHCGKMPADAEITEDGWVYRRGPNGMRWTIPLQPDADPTLRESRRVAEDEAMNAKNAAKDVHSVHSTSIDADSSTEYAHHERIEQHEKRINGLHVDLGMLDDELGCEVYALHEADATFDKRLDELAARMDGQKAYIDQGLVMIEEWERDHMTHFHGEFSRQPQPTPSADDAVTRVLEAAAALRDEIVDIA